MTAPVVTNFVPTSAGRSTVSMFFMILFHLQANPPTPKDADVFYREGPRIDILCQVSHNLIIVPNIRMLIVNFS